ncbi:Protein arginine N-methyltransferase 5 [Hypsibius exemplaris]|uniref:Protein arginine N-methyltransferase 5 n=1 Tax=Hypsibius exemplaris TaxID=2072580 RepID=A0A1W0X623_HYPEX|nr:Protein arginine N-methyltransferase 5 [Hypsibius exemplaris]
MSDQKDLTPEEKRALLSQFGLFNDQTVKTRGCRCINGPIGLSSSESSPAVDCLTSITANDQGVVLAAVSAKSETMGVALAAVGAFHRKESVPDCSNKNVIFSLQVPDLEQCSERECQTAMHEDFVTAAFTALEDEVRAVLIKPVIPKWTHEGIEFRSYKFAGALKKLLNRNFQLQYRDEASKQERVEALLKNKENQQGTPSFTSAKSDEVENSTTEVDPFRTLTPRQVWIQLSVNEKDAASSTELLSPEELHDQAWRWWSVLQSITRKNPKLALCLRVGSAVPEDSKRCQRWFSERLRAILIPDDVWRKNKAGFPILPPRLKEFLVKSFHIPQLTYLISDEGTGQPDRFRYLVHLYKDYLKSVKDPFRQKVMRHLADLPIRPLQPLRDHLTQEIYCVFEGDPIKYKLYRDASVMALQDLQKKGRGLARANPVVAMVVGAGRGPLVTQFIDAAISLGMFFKVYALDKNPIAISAMTLKLQSQWKPHATSIHVVQCDMRVFRPKEKADLLISELLGSFGCNELSPECLDGAQHYLKPDGISIPASYSNFVQPVMAINLYEDLLTYAPPQRKQIDELVLVDLRAFVEVAPYQEAFGFHHPNFAEHSNVRDCKLTFEADNDYRLTGFAGYFNLVLYGDISMNILPDKQTVGLTSWFPAFFGLSRPVDVKKGDRIVFQIGRRVSEENRRVWYVWALLEPEVLPLQNAQPTHWISM